MEYLIDFRDIGGAERNHHQKQVQKMCFGMGFSWDGDTNPKHTTNPFLVIYGRSLKTGRNESNIRKRFPGLKRIHYLEFIEKHSPTVNNYLDPEYVKKLQVLDPYIGFYNPTPESRGVIAPKIPDCKMDFRVYNKRVLETVQKICFANGVYWKSGVKDRVVALGIRFLYIEKGKLLYGTPTRTKHFKNAKLPELTPGQFIERSGKNTGIMNNTPMFDSIETVKNGIKTMIPVMGDIRRVGKPPELAAPYNPHSQGRAVDTRGHRHTTQITPGSSVCNMDYSQSPNDPISVWPSVRVYPNSKAPPPEQLKMLIGDVCNPPSKRELAYADKIAALSTPEPEKPAPIVSLADYKFPVKL